MRRADAQNPLTMRFAHYGADDHPSNIAAKQFAENVNKRTNGARPRAPVLLRASGLAAISSTPDSFRGQNRARR